MKTIRQRPILRRVPYAACAVACAAAVAGTPGFAANAAYADELADAQANIDQAQVTLDGAESQMAAISADYETLKGEVDQLQVEIDAAIATATATQDEVLRGREALGKLAEYEYRSGNSVSLISLLFESSDFTELLQNLRYFSAVTQHQADEVQAQRERLERFRKTVDDLNAKKDKQDQALAEAEEKRAQAQQLAALAASSLSQAQGEYASRVAALQAEADALAAEGAVSEPVVVEEANTVDRVEVVQDQPVQENPDPVAPGESEAGSSESSSESTVGWSVGVASAYGGSSDPYTPNPGTTATGAVCDDNSMGVAIPMAWPRYWQYYGRTVEISYGGKTVFATINDCGGMNGGERSLDLQPGVFKALGYSDCYAWGVRTVSYRIL